ncbi:cytoplasmic tRNA 2-thiolation protein 2 [Diplogelasinospora grovesii]|uniref:Cytoplasmic tRNA 2-thiolation protein 2 n=1 Tax=Diplogelasinospora grovesii TaxID=303347 RepID=A0AAN6NEZ6_9PEZI|nr:cytoplasmic tRNA 2-thiolation protein 2 [Diplogelasinospora grovesii]
MSNKMEEGQLTPPPPQPSSVSVSKRCKKCSVQEATLDSRGAPVCRGCFVKFINTKCVKQVAILGKETSRLITPRDGGVRRYLVGLSMGGVSSTVLVQLLNENVEFQLAKGRNAPFELVFVYVDPHTSLTLQPSSELSSVVGGSIKVEERLRGFRERYPRSEFKRVPLAAALRLRTVDWSSLIPPAGANGGSGGTDEEKKLQQVFDNLPSATSRTDMIRLLTRHVLLNEAREEGCQALLLGSTTTALAELTLAETAKGRGFSLPWLINDGSFPITHHQDPIADTTADAPPTPPTPDGTTADNTTTDAPTTAPNGTTTNITTNSPTVTEDGKGVGGETSSTSMLVYHPLRDLLRKELVTYASLVSPPLTDLLLSDFSSLQSGGAVVSHKNLSIEEVMFRYFEEVEQNYPSVVANVARTTGKLLRLEEDAEKNGRCGVCSMPLDELGDERWRGEIGDPVGDEGGGGGGGGGKGRLCYGCERSIHG